MAKLTRNHIEFVVEQFDYKDQTAVAIRVNLLPLLRTAIMLPTLDPSPEEIEEMIDRQLALWDTPQKREKAAKIALQNSLEVLEQALNRDEELEDENIL